MGRSGDGREFVPRRGGFVPVGGVLAGGMLARDERGEDFGGEFEGVEAGGVVVDLGGGDDFVGAGLFEEGREGVADGFR